MMRGQCDWCKNERDLVDGIGTVHLPELSAVVAEQPASREQPMKLCAGCASWHETQRQLRQQCKGHPTGDMVDYADAARHEFFTTWTPDVCLDDDEIEKLLVYFFRGIEVTIERVDYGHQMRAGFNVTLERFPEHQIVSCGQDRSKVLFEKQIIGISTRSHFHAFTMARGGAGNALAIGLNVFIREHAIRRRRPKEVA